MHDHLPVRPFEEDLVDLQTRALHHHRLQHARNRKPVPGTAQLTYYIFEGLLVGICGSDQLCVTAWSGGGGGAKKLTPQESANNPYLYALKAVEDRHKNPIVRGGPVPPGSWRVHAPGWHKGFRRPVCVLDPEFNPPNGRGGFLIHSQGEKGSDGCIVLPDAVFDRVMDHLKKSSGGHLQVCQAMQDSAFG